MVVFDCYNAEGIDFLDETVCFVVEGLPMEGVRDNICEDFGLPLPYLNEACMQAFREGDGCYNIRELDRNVDIEVREHKVDVSRGALTDFINPPLKYRGLCECVVEACCDVFRGEDTVVIRKDLNEFQTVPHMKDVDCFPVVFDKSMVDFTDVELLEDFLIILPDLFHEIIDSLNTKISPGLMIPFINNMGWILVDYDKDSGRFVFVNMGGKGVRYSDTIESFATKLALEDSGIVEWDKL